MLFRSGVAFLAEGAECEWDGTVAQFDVARLAHNIVGIGDDEVGESAVVLFEPVGAFGVWLAGHLGAKVGELLTELFDLGFSLEMLEGTADSRIGEADGDGAEGASIQFGVPLHDIERALRREGVVMAVDAGYDFAFLGIRVRRNGELRAFDGGLDGFGGRCARKWNGRGIDKGDGASAKCKNA